MLNEEQHQESQENLEEYAMLYVIVAIHTLGEAQKEIIAYVKELKNSIPKLSKKMSEKECVCRETMP